MLAALFLLSASPAIGATWYESYEKAEEALREEKWGEAVAHLNGALEQKPNSSANARTYGMRFIQYFPYLRLGVAYFHLGQADAALQAFETEERQKEIEKSAEGRAELADFRGRIENRRNEETTARQQRTPQVIAESLAAAREFELQGRNEDALAALARALAVAPEHPEATKARLRLLAAAADLRREQDRTERRAGLVQEGKTQLAAGKSRQAAASFSSALELRRDAEVEGLLEKAQEDLRAEIGGGLDAAERTRLLSAGLARATRYEEEGKHDEALAELQAVLALDPRNPQAQALSHRVLLAQAAAQKSAAESTTGTALEALLVEGDRLLASGDYEQALRSANRVLMLDATNERALRQTSQAYSRLSDFLLAPDKAPPAILLDDASEVVDESGERLVHSPDLTLRGTVYDGTPVELQFLADGVPVGTVTSSRREVQGLWITEFRWHYRAPSRSLALEIIALDRAGNRARVEYRVRYIAPFLRSPWFPAAVACGIALVPAGFFGYRRLRRGRLLRQRFNPYIAGAPILDQQRFFGRQQLREYVLRRIPNNSVMLYGERRIGKTSFQHELKRSLTQLGDPVHEFFPVFIDLQGTPQEKFFGTLAAEIFHELAPKLGGIQPSAPPRDVGYGYAEFVLDIQRVLKALKERSSRKVKLVLLIDEVDELNDYDPRINQRLRSLFMRAFADNLVSVVSGVSIKKHWEREGSPWYNFFQEIEMKPLDPEEARALIEAPVRGVFAFDTGVSDEIVRRTGGKPYLIQRLCSGLVDRLHSEKRRRVTLADVESACQVEGL